MRTLVGFRFLLAAIVALLLAGMPGRVVAAQQSVLRGVVKDSTGHPIESADIEVVSLHRLTRSDAKGRFSIDSVPSGAIEVDIRRLGYMPQKLTLAASKDINYSYEITLDAQPVQLDAMDVSEKRRRLGIEEFYQRRAKGVGAFFTRDDLLDRHAQVPTDVLRSTAGLRVVRTGNGSGVRFNSPSNARRDCMPLLWLDGQAVPGMEVDEVPVNDIEGIEVYQSLSTTPAQFWRGNATPCGTIVVWTRNPGSDTQFNQ